MPLQIPVGAKDEEREELLQRGDGGAGDSSNFAMAAMEDANMSSSHGESNIPPKSAIFRGNFCFKGCF